MEFERVSQKKIKRTGDEKGKVVEPADPEKVLTLQRI